MEASEIKMADFTSGGYFKVAVIKVSARLDEIKGGGGVRDTIESFA